MAPPPTFPYRNKPAHGSTLPDLFLPKLFPVSSEGSIRPNQSISLLTHLPEEGHSQLFASLSCFLMLTPIHRPFAHKPHLRVFRKP